MALVGRGWLRRLIPCCNAVCADFLPLGVPPIPREARKPSGRRPPLAFRSCGCSGRKPLPEHLARVEVRHEPACCTRPQCDGALVAIGEHVSERLACKPLDFYVRRDVYPQYACKACEQVVAEPVAAPADPALLFDMPVEDRWQGAAGRIGVDMARMADYSGHA